VKKKTRLIILGGGISGLSLAWKLSQQSQNEILLLEKEERVGGLMGSWESMPFFFERGPRMFQEGRSKALLELIHELGLTNEIIYADKAAQGRHILYKQKLHKFPSNPFAFLFSPLTRPLLLALFTEWKRAPAREEESIWDFAVRRFNQKTAERMFDPLVVGIYAGDMKRLSMSACFPHVKRWEEEHGSLTRAFFSKKKKAPSTLFSLRGGSEQLLETLREKLKGKILHGQSVQSLHTSSNGITIITTEGQWQADRVFSALPPYELCKLLSLQMNFPTRDIATVNIGFHSPVLTKKGFGYLVPAHANEDVFGVIFDSNLFPQQNRSVEETRLTVMLSPGGSEEKRALNALERHLHIHKKPDFVGVTKIARGLPQYELGHASRIQALQHAAHAFSPHLHLVGNYLSGASVNDAIATSKQMAANLFGVR